MRRPAVPLLLASMLVLAIVWNLVRFEWDDPWVLAIAVGLALPPLAVVAWFGTWAVAEPMRRRRNRRWARDRGWHHVPEPDPEMLSWYRGIPPFAGRVFDRGLAIGTVFSDGRVTLLDVTWSHPHRVWMWLAVFMTGPLGILVALLWAPAAALRSPQSGRVALTRTTVPVPDLYVTPENVWQRMRGHLHGEDIDFESDAFSRSFHVSCLDRRLAYDILHPRMLEWLLLQEKATWVWRGEWLARYVPQTMRARSNDQDVQALRDFIARTPRHVRADAQSTRRDAPQAPRFRHVAS